MYEHTHCNFAEIYYDGAYSRNPRGAWFWRKFFALTPVGPFFTAAEAVKDVPPGFQVLNTTNGDHSFHYT